MKEIAALRAQLQNQEKDFNAIQQEAFDEAKTYKELYHNAVSQRSAAVSRVSKLMMAVKAMDADAAENMEALREDNQRKRRDFDVSMISKLRSE